MQCPKCGADNPDDAFFCGACGTQMRSSFGVPPEAPPAYHPPEAEQAGTSASPGSNPFGAAEPHASAAFEALNRPAGDAGAAAGASGPAPPPPYMPPANPYNPGAGVAPPPQPYVPPPPTYAPPPPTYAPPPSPQPYQPPPYGQAPYGPPPPAGYAPPGYGMPPDGNTSGMGQGYPVPPQASGWTFAGFVPFGIFHFFNGNTGLGVLGLFTSLLSFIWFLGILNLGYSIYVGITGRESAWRNRRFNSAMEYDDTMRTWNTAGLVLLVLGVLVWIGFIMLFFVIFAAAISSAGH